MVDESTPAGAPCAPPGREADEALVLATIAQMQAELRPGDARPAALSLDTHLDRDLHLESLTRMELLSRIERAFDVRLAETAIAEADTPREILLALRAARPSAPAPRPPARVEGSEVPLPDPGSGAAAPEDTATLVDALEWHARAHPQRVHVHLLNEDGTAQPITYAELLERASLLAGGLVARGVAPGESVAIMLPTGREYLESFAAILLAGATPVPIYPPARVKQIEEHFRRHARILANAGTRMLITFEQVKQVSRLLAARVPGLRDLVTPAELARDGALDLRPRLAPGQVAFLQYTSGSTGDPKGVVLTHENILASLRCMRQALAAGPQDVFVSWLPLYHDMGLIGAWLGSLVVGFPLVLMSPLAFLARPERWPEAIHRFGGTISGGPNFSYELCLRRIEDQAMSGLDLSSWRLAFNGAEPVSPRTIERFCERFAAWGFRREAMTPVYGLAEATLGVAFTPVGRGPKVDRVSRDALYGHGRAEPAGAGVEALEVVSAGVPIPRFEVRVVDHDGHEGADRQEGEVEFKGPGATGGYLRNADATKALFHGDWVRSGDRGYLADGELYITGRDKDVVIRAGRNLYPYDLEQAVAEVPGVRRGCVAVFGSADPQSGTERLVVLAETRESDPGRRETMSRAIEALSLEHLDMPADEVLLVPPQTVLKTSSGKIRRVALAERHARGQLVVRSRAPWLQVLSLAADSLWPAVRGAARRAAGLLYAGRFALSLGISVAWVWPAVALLPTQRARWRAAHAAARSFLAMAGIRVTVEGVPPRGRGVLVANHQSYLDGVLLVAVMREPIAFVAKRELAARGFARRFLDGLGVLYVERFERERSVADARRIAEALAGGARVAVFPEGTFHRMPGLLPFQLGAFDTAVTAGVDVLPVVISGSRSVLRGEERFARRHPVTLRFLAPISPGAGGDDGSSWSAAVALRARTRERMLAASAEPDLQGRDVMTVLEARRGAGESR